MASGEWKQCAIFWSYRLYSQRKKKMGVTKAIACTAQRTPILPLSSTLGKFDLVWLVCHYWCRCCWCCSLISLAWILGECSIMYSPPARFFFFSVEICLRTLIPLFVPGSVHSGSASWDDRGQMFPDKLCVSSFSDGFPQYAWTAESRPSPNLLGQGYV